MQWWQAVADAEALGDIPEVNGLTLDSRQVRPGMAFAALPGANTDGHAFLEAAAAAGAACAVVQADRRELWAAFAGRLPLVVVPDARAAVGHLAAAAYGNPSRDLRLVGITGTDGKTHDHAPHLRTCSTAAAWRPAT